GLLDDWRKSLRLGLAARNGVLGGHEHDVAGSRAPERRSGAECFGRECCRFRVSWWLPLVVSRGYARCSALLGSASSARWPIEGMIWRSCGGSWAVRDRALTACGQAPAGAA